MFVTMLYVIIGCYILRREHEPRVERQLEADLRGPSGPCASSTGARFPQHRQQDRPERPLRRAFPQKLNRKIPKCL